MINKVFLDPNTKHSDQYVQLAKMPNIVEEIISSRDEPKIVYLELSTTLNNIGFMAAGTYNITTEIKKADVDKLVEAGNYVIIVLNDKTNNRKLYVPYYGYASYNIWAAISRHVSFSSSVLDGAYLMEGFWSTSTNLRLTVSKLSCLTDVPTRPTQDGTYTLKLTRNGSTNYSYSWVKDS